MDVLREPLLPRNSTISPVLMECRLPPSKRSAKTGTRICRCVSLVWFRRRGLILVSIGVKLSASGFANTIQRVRARLEVTGFLRTSHVATNGKIHS